jgi:P pilus assembly chaperone PapD
MSMTTRKATPDSITRFLFAALLLLLPLRAARADLTITPWRVVFQERDRTASIDLVNMSDQTNIYRLSWMQMKMDKNGRYVLVPEDGDKDPHSVANMVVFAPRQVTIEPHGQQTIRVSLRRPADLPFGEYRAHLLMKKLAKQGPERQDPNAKNITMALKVNLSFSVPVIVRSGEDKDLKISLTSPKLAMRKDTKLPTPELDIDINRDAGTFSSYGSLQVYWDPLQGKEEQIGDVNNIALYPEIKQRMIDIPLSENPTNGRIRVVYKGKYESEGKIWDEKTFAIGR